VGGHFQIYVGFQVRRDYNSPAGFCTPCHFFKSKVASVPEHVTKAYGWRISKYVSNLHLGFRWGEWSASRSGPFTLVRDPKIHCVGDGCAPQPFWTSQWGENSKRPYLDSNSGRPACSQKLHWANKAN